MFQPSLVRSFFKALQLNTYIIFTKSTIFTYISYFKCILKITHQSNHCETWYIEQASQTQNAINKAIHIALLLIWAALKMY